MFFRDRNQMNHLNLLNLFHGLEFVFFQKSRDNKNLDDKETSFGSLVV